MAPYTPEPLTAAHVPAKETTERLIWEEHIFSPVCDKLQDESIDPIAEQALTAAVIHKPTLCFEFLVILAPDVFATEAARFVGAAGGASTTLAVLE